MALDVLGTFKLTMVNTGKFYNTLPTITLSRGGNPGVITGYSSLVGFILPPTVTAKCGGGSGYAVDNALVFADGGPPHPPASRTARDP